MRTKRRKRRRRRRRKRMKLTKARSVIAPSSQQAAPRLTVARRINRDKLLKEVTKHCELCLAEGRKPQVSFEAPPTDLESVGRQEVREGRGGGAWPSYPSPLSSSPTYSRMDNGSSSPSSSSTNPASGAGFALVIISMLCCADFLISLAACGEVEGTLAAAATAQIRLSRLERSTMAS